MFSTMICRESTNRSNFLCNVWSCTYHGIHGASHVNVYGARDIFILLASFLGLILKDDLKLLGSGITIFLQSCMFKCPKLFLNDSF